MGKSPTNDFSFRSTYINTVEANSRFYEAVKTRSYAKMFSIVSSVEAVSTLVNAKEKPAPWMHEPTRVGHIAMNTVSSWLLEIKPQYTFIEEAIRFQDSENEYFYTLSQANIHAEDYEIAKLLATYLFHEEISGFESALLLMSLMSDLRRFNDEIMLSHDNFLEDLLIEVGKHELCMETKYYFYVTLCNMCWRN